MAVTNTLVPPASDISRCLVSRADRFAMQRAPRSCEAVTQCQRRRGKVRMEKVGFKREREREREFKREFKRERV